MKTLIRNADSLAIYAQDALILSKTGTTGTGWFDPNHTSANSVLLDLTLPPLWTGAVWSYTGGVWAVVDTVRHQSLIAAAYTASIPQVVTMRQARLALLAAGKLASVNSAIAGMSGAQGDAARIEWEFSSEVKRGQPLVKSLGPALGMSETQMDSLFIAAAAL